MKKTYYALAAIFFSVICAVTFILNTGYEKAHTVTPLKQDSLVFPENVNKLMIVAHPDDETLWGGAHLLEGDWLVVSLTHGSDSTRSSEFREAVSSGGNIPMLLNYPDKVNFTRDDWSLVSEYIKDDICSIIESKKWEIVATHNPAGEYGHIHHKLTSSFVTESFKVYSTGTLYYFGDYYSAKKLPEAKVLLTPIEKEKLDQKLEICSIYRSQKRTVQKLSHMLPYEEWEVAMLK